ncbi:MAG: sugar phosphate isomerase/epimerase [Kiritimatiellae bacterium]|nr:sugar phosphate isomerase/epimerase [Kiritimatiellia bacterium]MDD5519818.1 sugar phosphate isomerase/epimerase [Kiritimatiellia bacterium]
MNRNLNRRDFMKVSATTGLSLFAAGRIDAAPFKTTLRKAMILTKVTEAALKPYKDAGFDGIQSSGAVTPEEAAENRKIAEKLGMQIHTVSGGWAEFNSDDPKKVEASLAKVEKALRAARAYGSDAILLVPCRVDKMPMPEPWEFEIEFDEKTSHVKRVAAGDNEKYSAYIKAQNRATDMTRDAVRKLIPLAKEMKVAIALENVWNNLWVTCALYKNFVASFQSQWVRSFYDVGNHVKYPGKPQDWIRALGPLIAKVHIKDFLLNPDGHGGKFVHPRDGSVDWPAVRQALDDVNHNGWLTIEDGGLPLEEFNRRLDLIIAGK